MLCPRCGNDEEFYMRSNGKPMDCCKKCYIKRSSNYQYREKEQVNARARARYVQNPDKYKKQSHDWYAVHPDIRSRVNYNYDSTHPKTREQNQANGNRRRARIRNNGGSFTTSEWTDLCNRFQNKCVCCGASAKLTVDHVIPLALGGSNNIDNIQPLCFHCNARKHTTIIDYRST